MFTHPSLQRGDRRVQQTHYAAIFQIERMADCLEEVGRKADSNLLESVRFFKFEPARSKVPKCLRFCKSDLCRSCRLPPVRW